MKKIIIGIVLLFIIGIVLFFFFSKEEEYSSVLSVISKSEILEKDYKKGLTIRDSYQNEFVWITVDRDKVFKTARNDKDYKRIQNDILEYTKEYRNDDYVDDDKYLELKKEVLSSIYRNGGFWISRYEIGSTENKLESNIQKEVYSQPNLYVYNMVTMEEAEELSQTISNGEYHSHLLFGFEWDLVCKFIEEYGYTPKGNKITSSMLTVNSNSLGNYYSSTFSIQRGEYSNDYGMTYHPVDGIVQKPSYQNYLLTTGASDDNQILNIYDFVGNVSEFVLEEYTKDSSNVVLRDGDFSFNYGGNNPVSARYHVKENSKNMGYGFRVALYIE